jgi:hypothetical protein
MPATKRARKTTKKVIKPVQEPSPSDVLTIDNIPDHILMKIFKTFDNTSIENAAQVCKR